MLVVDGPRIYDQDGELRATIKPSAHNDSFLRRLVSTAPSVQEVVDVNDQLLLTLETIGQRTFRSRAANRAEIASIIVPPGSRRNKTCAIEVTGDVIGALYYCERHGKFSVRDTGDAEMARLTHVTPRFGALRYATGCNVIEIDERMPETLRPLVLAASHCVFRLTTASA
jgi:hypothetical protein